MPVISECDYCCEHKEIKFYAMNQNFCSMKCAEKAVDERKKLIFKKDSPNLKTTENKTDG
jgi:hypothetical protein